MKRKSVSWVTHLDCQLFPSLANRDLAVSVLVHDTDTRNQNGVLPASPSYFSAPTSRVQGLDSHRFLLCRGFREPPPPTTTTQHWNTLDEIWKSAAARRPSPGFAGWDQNTTENCPVYGDDPQKNIPGNSIPRVGKPRFQRRPKCAAPAPSFPPMLGKLQRSSHACIFAPLVPLS